MLQAPAGNNSGVTNGSASVPFDTTLVFAAGSTLKLQNASLYVQNQGSALQAEGTTTNPVNFTSYNDASDRRRHQQQPRHHSPSPATGAASSSATTTRPRTPIGRRSRSTARWSA